MNVTQTPPGTEAAQVDHGAIPPLPGQLALAQKLGISPDSYGPNTSKVVMRVINDRLERRQYGQLQPLLELRPQNIPAELQPEPWFACWKWRLTYTSPEKLTKVPFNPMTGKPARSNDPSTWSRFDDVVEACLEKGSPYHGAGLMFAPESGLAGADLDKSFDRTTGEMLAWAQPIIRRLNAYAELSPSATGMKCLFYGQLPRNAAGKTRNRKDGFGEDGTGSIEVYDNVRFFTLTGHVLGGAPLTLEARQEELDALHHEWFYDWWHKPAPVRQPVNGTHQAGDISGLTDNDLWEVLFRSRNGERYRRLFNGDLRDYANNHSVADAALLEGLGWVTQYDHARTARMFQQSGLNRDKWDREDYRDRTIDFVFQGKSGGYSPPKPWAINLTSLASRPATPHLNGTNGTKSTADVDSGCPDGHEDESPLGQPTESEQTEPEPQPDPQTLLGAAVAAEPADRPDRLRALAGAVAHDAFLADHWGQQVKEAKIATKGAFLKEVEAIRKAQRRQVQLTVAAGGKPDPLPERVLPRIDADNQCLPAVTEQALNALQEGNDPPRLFRYGSLPSRIETDDQGAPLIRPLTEDRMRYALARAAHWYCWDPELEAERDAMPPMSVVKDVLATPGIPLPILTRIVQAPVFSPSGELQLEPGYHPASQTYYSPALGFTVPPVPERPTGADIKEARNLIVTELLGDFPFTSDAERAHAVALLLLPFVRDFIAGPTPMHLMEKPAPGTGSSLLANVLTYPALGRPASVMTQGKGDEEMRKRLTSTLLKGPAVVLIDNLSGTLDSATLAAAVTAETWEDRILGVSENAALSIRCAWIGTANNLSLSNEMTRRVVRIRMDARCNEPWLRTGFKHPDLRGWARENRAKLVWAALTLGRAWITKDRPLFKDTVLGMYELWSGVMGGILSVAEIPGFLENLADFYQSSNSEVTTLNAFIAAWWSEFGSSERKAAELYHLATEPEPLLDLGGRSEQSQKIRLGYLLRSLRDRQFKLTINDTEVELRVVAARLVQRVQTWKLVDINSEEFVNSLLDDTKPPRKGADDQKAGECGESAPKTHPQHSPPDNDPPQAREAPTKGVTGESGESFPHSPRAGEEKELPGEEDEDSSFSPYTREAHNTHHTPHTHLDLSPEALSLWQWAQSHEWGAYRIYGGLNIGPGQDAWETWLHRATEAQARNLLAEVSR